MNCAAGVYVTLPLYVFTNIFCVCKYVPYIGTHDQMVGTLP